MNPFESQNYGGAFYTDLVHGQVIDLKEGQSKKVDLCGKTVNDFRMTLRHISKTRMGGAKFKTKISSDGTLWALRVNPL